LRIVRRTVFVLKKVPYGRRDENPGGVDLTKGLEENVDSLPAGRMNAEDHNRLAFEFAEAADTGLEGLVPDFDPKALEDEP
jgi:hypothetical protein